MNNQQSHPILYSAPMVRARRAGIKTMTRRAVRDLHPDCVSAREIRDVYGAIDWKFYDQFDRLTQATRCPYGQPGDLLWVKETFFAWGRWETRFNAKKSRDEWHFVDMTLECGHAYMYAADDQQPDKLGGVTPQWWRRPAIFMPRVASRGLDEIVSVRAERLQDLSEADAMAEGCQAGDFEYYENAEGTETAKQSYECLWESINGTGSWELNPWVWVVEFKALKGGIA